MTDPVTQALQDAEIPLLQTHDAGHEQDTAVSSQTDYESDPGLLLEASGTLLVSRTSDELVRTTIEVASRLVPADGYAIWQRKRRDTWVLRSSSGLSDQFTSVSPLKGYWDAPEG